MSLLVFLLGVFGGLIAGTLGIGGGILFVPLLMYGPLFFGLPGLSMKTIAGLTIVQSLVGSASGFIVHRRQGAVHRDLVLWMGTSLLAGSFAGGFLSKFVSSDLLSAVFAGLALAATVLMLLPTREEDGGEAGAVPEIPFHKPRAVGLAVVVGFFGGLIGQGGSFLIVPLMIHVLKIPTRITLGTSLSMVLMGSAAGVAGKILGLQVDFSLALALVAGAFPGAWVGAVLSHRTRPAVLRRSLAVVIGLAAVKMWADVIRAFWQA